MMEGAATGLATGLATPSAGGWAVRWVGRAKSSVAAAVLCRSNCNSVLELFLVQQHLSSPQHRRRLCRDAWRPCYYSSSIQITVVWRELWSFGVGTAVVVRDVRCDLGLRSL